MRKLFAGVELSGHSVLDIGAGDGAASLYAACCGASRVVSLEPEADGSRTNVRTRFEESRVRVGAQQVELRAERLQEFDAKGERFDVLLAKASINHLDEDACMRLHTDPDARARYLVILRTLAELSCPGGALVIADCARSNVFATLGRRNPLKPTIEWGKHQSPTLWAELLSQVGFEHPRIRWTTLNTLRSPGQYLLGNRVCAYFLTGTFVLTMSRVQVEPEPAG